MHFIDTNVMIYSFRPEAGAKHARAIGIVQHALGTGEGVISSQVIKEFFAVALRKFPVPPTLDECHVILQGILSPLCQVLTSVELCAVALDLQRETSYSFYDCLIVAAALEADCDELYTEDLQHGRDVRSLTIVNPFLGV